MTSLHKQKKKKKKWYWGVVCFSVYYQVGINEPVLHISGESVARRDSVKGCSKTW